jgi:hypothetical protein
MEEFKGSKLCFEDEIAHLRKEVAEQVSLPGPARPRQHHGRKALYGPNQLLFETASYISHV